MLKRASAASAGVDVRSAGLATHFIPSHRLPDLEARLQKLGEDSRGRGRTSPPDPTASTSDASPASHLPGPPLDNDAGDRDNALSGASCRSGGGRGQPLDLSDLDRVISEAEAEAGPLPVGHLHEMMPWISRHFTGPVAGAVGSIVSSLELRRQQLGESSSGPEAEWVGETLRALAK